MKRKALLAGMLIAIAPTAALADNFLAKVDDRSEGQFVITFYRNNVPFQTLISPGENARGKIDIQSGATVVTTFDDQTNFFEPSTKILSDTAEVSGIAGDHTIIVEFHSDDDVPLIPLPDGGVHFETGDFQNVVPTPIVVSNGDTYNFQMASDLDSVPEPATWALMLLGLVGLGAVMRTTRRKKIAALAQV